VGVEVTAPDGRVWRVRRRWFRRSREPAGADEAAAGSVLGDLTFGVFGEIFAVFAVALIFVGVILIFLSLVFLVLEAIVLALAALALGRPWTIEAVTDGPPPERMAWKVRGWRASRRAIEDVAAQLRGGLGAEPRAADPETEP